MAGLIPVSEPRMTPSTDLSMVKAVSPFNEADTRAILRQVEFYFSDQNLPQDAHLLGRTGGDGNGATSLNEICSFKKMRAFKPRSKVKEVLKQSAVIELVDNGKKVKRRYPLTLKLLVQPRIDLERQHVERTLANNPHLTKNFIKPTGFEASHVDFPITPQEHETNLKLYDPECSFWLRIENAIGHYCSKRKMHQKTKRVFDLWMEYGGISNNTAQFSSGHTDFDADNLDKEELALLKHQFTVSDLVLQNENSWTVDFEGVAIGFLSTEFLSSFEWHIPDQVQNVCNVMRNFFNFLLHHNVCPEYTAQLHSAKIAVDRAELELYTLPDADRELHHPHSFNAACTIGFSGPDDIDTTLDRSWDDTLRNDPPPHELDLSREDARTIFAAGITAFGHADELDEMMREFAASRGTADSFDTGIVTETIGLEITAIELAQADRAQLFTSLEGTIVPRMGLMHCKLWHSPCGPFYDAPPTRSQLPESFRFIVNESALALCTIGMKLDAQVKMLKSTGLCWLDQIYTTNPSFFLYLSNTRMKEIKQRQKDHDAFQAWLRDNPEWSNGEDGLYRCTSPIIEAAA